MWETWVHSLDWEDILEEGMSTHSSILAWRIPVVRRAWWATVHGSQRIGTRLSNTHIHDVPVFSDFFQEFCLLLSEFVYYL